MSLKIKNFSRANLPLVERQLKDRLEKIGEELGLKLSIGGIKFSSASFETKLTVAVIGEDGVAQTPERRNWALYAKGKGLPEDGLDKVITMNGQKYRVVGFCPQRPRYPVLCDKLDGSRGQTLFTVEGARRALAEVVS